MSLKSSSSGFGPHGPVDGGNTLAAGKKSFPAALRLRPPGIGSTSVDTIKRRERRRQKRAIWYS